MFTAILQLAEELGLSHEHLLKLARDIARNRELPSVGHLEDNEAAELCSFLERAAAHRLTASAR